jgi:hypothetical protein
MKFGKRLTLTILCLLMTSWSGKTNAFGQESTPNPKKIIKLDKDWPAPFSGRLMTDDAFRHYVNSTDEMRITRAALKDCQQESTKGPGSAFATAVGAFVLGALSVYYIRH